MIQLNRSLRAWGTPEFEAVLKQEIAQFRDELPLQQGLLVGSYVAAGPITAVINGSAEVDGVVRVRAGIFYQSAISAASCDGDPTPDSENTEYCEVQLDIDKRTAETAVALMD